MTLYVDLDFETASGADLKLCGAWVYANHPTTEVLCLSFKPAGYPDTPYLWLPGDAGPWRSLLGQLSLDPNVVFVAHNAGFEQAIWSCIMVPVFGFPAIPLWQWEDTMAAAAWKAIPLALDKGARALGLPFTKDMEGNRLTLGMSRVDKKTGMLPARTPEKLARIAEYCAQDVVVETAMRHRIGLLSQQSPKERQVWLYDQQINQRGVRIDLDFVRQAQLVIERASKPLLAEFRDLTAGVNPGQVAKVKEWAAGQGVELENLQKGYLAELLDDEEDDHASLAAEDDVDAGAVPPRELPVQVRRVLEIRQMLGSASIKKLARMRACVGEDGRARGLLQYHAASPGRWGGRLIQPQNFPRPEYRDANDKAVHIDPELAVSAIMSGDPELVEAMLGFSAITCVSYSLRHALVPDPGKVFLVGDFAGIEARIVLAMAGQHDKTELMRSGRDVYLDMASTIFGGTYTKEDITERQAGKATVLGAGFQMGGKRFREEAKKKYGVELSEADAFRAINNYRKEWAPRVPPLWYGLDKAALRAAQGARRVEQYGVEYNLEGDWLTARLPSGWQKLWYHRPVLGRDERFDRECWLYSAYKGDKHIKNKAYGGLLTENSVQGLARGLLCAAIDRLERADMPVVLTVHDEAVCEVDEGRADLQAFEQLMAEPTGWAQDMRIPVAVEAWAGDRYRK